MIVYKVPQYFLDALESNKTNQDNLLDAGKPFFSERTGLPVKGLDREGRLLFVFEGKPANIPGFIRYDREAKAYTARTSTKEGKQLRADFKALLDRIDFKFIHPFSLLKCGYLSYRWKIETVQGVKCFVVYEGIDPVKEGWEAIEI